MTAEEAKAQLLLDCITFQIGVTIASGVAKTFDDILVWKGGDVDAAYTYVRQELFDLIGA